MPNAWELTKSLYSRMPNRSLWADIELCAAEGVVAITPGYVVMGRRVGHGWLVHFALGRGAMGEFVRHMPYYLPFTGWARRGSETIRWYPTERVLERINKQKVR
jgi:hypothetical protein